MILLVIHQFECVVRRKREYFILWQFCEGNSTRARTQNNWESNMTCCCLIILCIIKKEIEIYG